MNIAYNMDCLEAMKSMPDNAFDLAVVDPPYGDGQNVDNRGGDSDSTDSLTATNLRCHGGDRWDKYNMETLQKQAVTRTGGTWAEKYGKKSLRGT